ncbi:predicted protein [Micromonas commoda]|uniref:COP9 signalosome complex subunit 6 n=1 Tax=Micromonas commoda (strain RCC299 / NOUM17 / CCMP2709) TaxID=296587 RepID=C1E4E6_MICCC|nr:predicted protein [Micromonas commoda]ACO62709.1 predicted protein [Micromonas commoda]|eukprot:XP_002501451.1 predicted protein [Micromonas commoda]
MEAYKLHPLALVNISDHYIRFKAQLPPEEEPPRVLGCLLGFQEGNRDLEICNSFELIWTPEEGTGRVIVDAEYLAGQKVRYKTVYPKMEVVGWYSTGQAVDHEHDLAIHKAICDASEAPVYLLFDPFRVGAGEGTSTSRHKLRGAKLPIDIVEAVVHVGADGQSQTSFRPAKYAIETTEVERIATDTLARAQEGEGTMTGQYVSHLRNLGSATEMLNARVEAIVEYLRAADSGEIERPDRAALRAAAALVKSLPKHGGSARLRADMVREYNDCLLTAYLATMTKGMAEMDVLQARFDAAGLDGSGGGAGGGGRRGRF